MFSFFSILPTIHPYPITVYFSVSKHGLSYEEDEMCGLLLPVTLLKIVLLGPCLLYFLALACICTSARVRSQITIA